MSETTPEAKDEPIVRPFAATLQELDKGRVHTELSEKLHELIAAAKDTGKAGKITFTVTVTPDPKTDMLRFGTTVAAKLPAAQRAESLFFVDKHGNPTRQDPHQIALLEANNGRLAAVPQASNGH